MPPTENRCRGMGDKECEAACDNNPLLLGLTICRRFPGYDEPWPILCCVCDAHLERLIPGTIDAEGMPTEGGSVILDCAANHEMKHLQQPCVHNPVLVACQEAEAYEAEIACLEERRRQCQTIECSRSINQRLYTLRHAYAEYLMQCIFW